MKELEEVLKGAQACLSTNPVVILGSGASVPYGVGGMQDLSNYLKRVVVPKTEIEVRDWDAFLLRLNEAGDLEKALDDVNPDGDIYEKIVFATRTKIVGEDLRAFNGLLTGSSSSALSRLYRHLFDSTHKRISVVTTNYDRIAEYAADFCGVHHTTGFCGGYYQEFQEPYLKSQRTVEIWKVHGSLDWFTASDGRVFCLPFLDEKFTDAFAPLMVTPGKHKYKITHQDPYRSVIANADKAILNANGALVVGYGFNDEHIQTKLVARKRGAEFPLVVLSKSLTAAAKAFLENISLRNWVALEERNGSTIAYYPNHPEGIELPDIQLWDFSTFVNMAIQ